MDRLGMLALAFLLTNCAAHRGPAGEWLARDDPRRDSAAGAAVSWLVKGGRIPRGGACVVLYEAPSTSVVERELRARCRHVSMLGGSGDSGLPVPSEMVSISIGPVAWARRGHIAVGIEVRPVFGGSRYAAILAFKQSGEAWEFVSKESALPRW